MLTQWTFLSPLSDTTDQPLFQTNQMECMFAQRSRPKLPPILKILKTNWTRLFFIISLIKLYLPYFFQYYLHFQILDITYFFLFLILQINSINTIQHQFQIPSVLKYFYILLSISYSLLWLDSHLVEIYFTWNLRLRLLTFITNPSDN